MTIELKKYVAAIVASKEEKNASLAPARAGEQKGRLGLEIATLKVNIAGQENRVAELAGQYPLDIDAIVAAQDELDLDNRRLTQLQALDGQLFG
jgi:hypothetical protein